MNPNRAPTSRGVYDKPLSTNLTPDRPPVYPLTTCAGLNSNHAEPQNPPYLGHDRTQPRPVFDGLRGEKTNLKVAPEFGGNFSRNLYDVGSVEIETRQATAPLEWLLDPVFAEQCSQCRPASEGWISKQGVSYDTKVPIVETENELFNLTRILSRDPNYKYLPYCPHCGNVANGLPCGDGVSAGCDKCQPQLYNFQPCGVKFEYTRLSNPTCNFRETGTNRFQPICLNPQDEQRWLPQGEVGINFRLISKDNHVPIIPYPLNDAPLRPRGGDIPCQVTSPVCGAYTAPMHNFYIA